MRRQHAACSEVGQTGIGIAQSVLGIALTFPDRQDTKCLGQVFHDHIGPELVEIEPVGERPGKCAWHIEEEAATIRRLGLGDDKIGDDLALGCEQGGKARTAWCHLARSVVTRPLRNLRPSGPATLMTPRSGRSAAFMGGYLPDFARKRKASTRGYKGGIGDGTAL